MAAAGMVNAAADSGEGAEQREALLSKLRSSQRKPATPSIELRTNEQIKIDAKIDRLQALAELIKTISPDDDLYVGSFQEHKPYVSFPINRIQESAKDPGLLTDAIQWEEISEKAKEELEALRSKINAWKAFNSTEISNHKNFGNFQGALSGGGHLLERALNELKTRRSDLLRGQDRTRIADAPTPLSTRSYPHGGRKLAKKGI
ncbi:hypothetical protein OAN22_02365 [Alphaproteobacteria bacterium]|nr:hypothetical protein [Alphaproteobacteria bacterium]